MYSRSERHCPEPVVVDHQAPAASSSPYYFAYPEATICQDLLGLLSHPDESKETSRFRGDVPSKKTRGPFPPGCDDGGHLVESTIGSQGYFTGSTADYSSQSYRSKIATFSSGISEAHTKPGLQPASFKGGDDEADKKPHLEPSLQSGYNAQTKMYHNQVVATSTDQRKSYDQVQAKKHDRTVKPNEKDERKAVEYYKKATYAVLIGDTVRVCNTKLYASLPLCNKCMVKERVKDSSGTTRVKLKLKTFDSRLVCSFTKHEIKHVWISLCIHTIAT